MMICAEAEQNAVATPEIGSWSGWQDEQQKAGDGQVSVWPLLLLAAVVLLLSGEEKEAS